MTRNILWEDGWCLGNFRYGTFWFHTFRKAIKIFAIYVTWNVYIYYLYYIVILHEIFHDFPATFQVITRKVDYLWDSAGRFVSGGHFVREDVFYVLIQRTLCTLSNISNIYSFCTVYTLPLKVWRIAPILIRYMATHLTYVLGWHNGGPPNPTSRGRVAARLNLSSLGTFIEGIIIGGANNTQPHNKNLYFLEICFKCFLLYFINYQITRLK